MRKLMWVFCFAVAGLLIAACAGSMNPAGLSPSATQLERGASSFVFSGWGGPDLKVWTYRPETVDAATPVVFVMHGTKRDGDRYRDEWSGFAEANDFILIVPEFPRPAFPDANAYNLGNVLDGETGARRTREKWSFSAIEPIFDEVKARSGSEVAAYSMYGHSAGAQFVHRFVYFVPQARLKVAVSANAGWYTMPDLTQPWPYGLGGTGLTEADLERALSRPLQLLLGTDDLDPADTDLRVTPEASAQGPHRFARGHSFFESGKAASAQAGSVFGWSISYASGIGHSNGKMSAFAAPLLAGQEWGDATGELDILFLGDTNHAESYQEKYEAEGKGNILTQKGYDYSFVKVAPLLKASGFVIMNLETPLTRQAKSPYPEKDYVHWSDPVQATDAFSRLNVGAVSLANNHALDYGEAGLNDTLAALDGRGIAAFGAGVDAKNAAMPLRKDFRVGTCDVSLAVFGRFEYRADYDADFHTYAAEEKGGVAPLDVDSLSAEIKALKARAPETLVVVYPHWGENYSWKLPAQVEAATRLADAGADLIIGHGSHTVGEVESIGDTLVVYSIGNFVFNSGGRFDRAPDVLPISLMARLLISGTGQGDVLRLYPILSDNKVTAFQPNFAGPDAFALTANTLAGRPDRLATLGGGRDSFGSYLEAPLPVSVCAR